MRNINQFLFLLIGLFALNSCEKENKSNSVIWSDSTTLNQANKDLKAVWDTFKNTVRKNDLKAINKLSTNCIYCTECHDNSEKVVLDSSNQRYIMVDKFFNKHINYFNDFAMNEKNIGWIRERDQTYFELNSDCNDFIKLKSNYLEVSISEPNCGGEECSQVIYSFINTNDGYKFCGVLDIP